MATITVLQTVQRQKFVAVLTEELQKLVRTHSLGRNEPIVLKPEHFALYGEALGHLSPEQLKAAFLKTAQTCRYFPKPADILAQIEVAETKGFQLESEREWQKLLVWIRRHVFPDTGVERNAPRLPAAVEHAAKAAGGIFYIERCSSEDLVWARKNFLAAYTNVHETGQAEHLLSDGNAKRIWRELNAGPQPIQKQFASVPIVEIGSDRPSRAEVREVLDRVSAERPRTEPNESQDAMREKWEEQKARARAWVAPTNPAGSQAASR
jgi:hypothetical protein